MATSIKDIKNIQELRGAEAIRGEFYLVANRGSANQMTLGFTQEGTFGVEREYRNATQNQTVSGVKGLIFLDSATVTFETSSLQVNGDLLEKFKGFEVDSFTDDNDGTEYARYKEKAFLDWNKYIDTLDLMFEFTDGKVGAIRMFNVVDKSADSWVFNRTDDLLVSVSFEATIDENDSDHYLPYEILIEKTGDETIVDRASGDISKHAFEIAATAEPEEAKASIKEAVETYLGTFKDFEEIECVTDETVVDEIVGKETNAFGKVEVVLSKGTATQTTVIGVTAIHE